MRKNASRDAVVRRHLRLRKKISGTAERPRLNVFRSCSTSMHRSSMTQQV